MKRTVGDNHGKQRAMSGKPDMRAAHQRLFDALKPHAITVRLKSSLSRIYKKGGGV